MSITLIRLALVTATALSTTIYAAADAGGDPSKHPVFDQIDTDHDGFITREEWKAGKEILEKMRRDRPHDRHPGKDQDGHGGKDPGREPGDKPKPDGMPLFDKMDANKDDKISLAEWIAFRDAHRPPRREGKEGKEGKEPAK